MKMRSYLLTGERWASSSAGPVGFRWHNFLQVFEADEADDDSKAQCDAKERCHSEMIRNVRLYSLKEIPLE
jgi:hypothetical protein